MNTCDTCKHWIRSNGVCNHPKVGGIPDHPEPDTARLDREDVPIITGPKFGCVHWEEKD